MYIVTYCWEIYSGPCTGKGFYSWDLKGHKSKQLVYFWNAILLVFLFVKTPNLIAESVGGWENIVILWYNTKCLETQKICLYCIASLLLKCSYFRGKYVSIKRCIGFLHISKWIKVLKNNGMVPFLLTYLMCPAFSSVFH